MAVWSQAAVPLPALQRSIAGRPFAYQAFVVRCNIDSLLWSAFEWRDVAPGAQTERRGGAGPVRGLLGGKDPTGRFSLIARRLVVVRPETAQYLPRRHKATIRTHDCGWANFRRDDDGVEANPRLVDCLRGYHLAGLEDPC